MQWIHKVLSDAHLSYKCTICKQTYVKYKNFEQHVFMAHSGGAKKNNACRESKHTDEFETWQVTNSQQQINPSNQITCLPQKKNYALTKSSNTYTYKVKIHPKMIYNRPPLNCQKCQFRSSRTRV